MTTKEIKKFLKETFGLKNMRVQSTLTKRPYFTAWIPSDNRHLVHGPMTYSSEFPLSFRQMALRVIYGDDCKFAETGGAGNVNAHSVAMHEPEWNKLIERWTVEVNAVGMLNPYPLTPLQSLIR